MTTKYHINQKTGKVSECNAKVRDCPVGGKHYSTEAAATKAYEAANQKHVAQTPMKKASKKKAPVEVDGVLPGMEIPGEDLAETQARLAKPRLVETHGGVTVGKLTFTDVEPREQETLQRVLDANMWDGFSQSAEADEAALADLDEYLNDWDTEDRIKEIEEIEARLEASPGAAGSSDLRWKLNLLLDASAITVAEKARTMKTKGKKAS